MNTGDTGGNLFTEIVKTYYDDGFVYFIHVVVDLI